MKNKYNQHLPVLLFLAVIIVLAVVLFACETSKNQDIQITNVFTPGMTQAGVNQTQIPGSTTNPTESAQATAEVTLFPSALPTMIVTNAQGQPVFVTQTRVSVQPGQPTNTRTAQQATQNPYPIASVTATRAVTPVYTQSHTLTTPPTSTQPPYLPEGWEGEWTVFYEQPGSGVIKTTLVISLDGTNLNATMAIDNVQYLYTGFIFNEGIYATGLWSGGGSDGSFWWNLDPAGQFRGCHQNKFAFCGTRDGVIQPSPCLQIPTS